ncbi:MAG: ABC transporter permease [Acidobacteria bacterium]|nr:ABC transporter permease [Acidobacteriota bacterium]
MVNRMVFANLVTRPVRTLVAVMAIAVEVVLILMVVGLTSGLLEEVAKRTQGVGADIMVQPQTTSLFMGFTGAPMPIQIQDRLAQVPQVEAVAPVMLQMSTASGVSLIYGIDTESFDQVTGGFRYLEGRGLEQPDEVLVDDIFAHSQGLHAGDDLELLNHPLRLAGIVEHGKGARIFMKIDALQDMMGSVGKASVFFVKLSDPDHTGNVLAQFREILPNYQLRDMREYLSLMTSSNIPGLGNFINVMIGLAISIGLLVIFISIYSTVVERTREIGILKSMGASKKYIVNLVLRETTLLTILGIGTGIGLSYLVRSLIVHTFPTMTILLTGEWMLRASLIALATSLLGASYPALKATRQDAIQALAYE